MLSELVEYSHKLEEKMKAMLSEIKENIQGTKSDRKETDSNQCCRLEGKKKHWTRRKKDTFNQNRMKKQEFKKMRGLGTSRTSLNAPTFEL